MPNKRNKKPAKKRGVNTDYSAGFNALGPVSIADLSANRPTREEVKYHDNFMENVTLFHCASAGLAANTITSSYFLTAFPQQGTSATQRIGDRVNLKEIAVRIWMSNKSDRPNVMYRVSAIIVPGLVGGTSGAWSTYFAGVQSILAMPKVDNCTLLYDKIINPDQHANTLIPSNTYTGKERSFQHQFAIPVNKVVSVNSSFVCDTANIVLFVTAYDAYATLATDAIGTYAVQSRVYFTDS